MKKISVFLLAGIMVLCFAGCRTNMEPAPSPSTTPMTTVAPDTTVPPTSSNIPNIPDPSVDDNVLDDMLPEESIMPKRPMGRMR